MYFNSAREGEDPLALWDDAKRQMSTEVASWPYSFPASDDYQSAEKRVKVSGKLMVSDRSFYHSIWFIFEVFPLHKEIRFFFQFFVVGGWLASLSVAGYTAIAVRKMVNTEMTAAEPMAKPSPFSSLELWCWSGIFVVSFTSTVLYPTFLGTNARTCLPFLLASTVIGYIVGSGLPSNAKKILHPIICCALSADLAALAYGQVSKYGLDPVLGYYLTKVSSNPGAGDILMGFLGSVILSFAFSMFQQRKDYQFWTRADEKGYFSIINVRTGTYNLYAWVPGFIGDYRNENIITIQLLKIVPAATSLGFNFW